MSDNSALIVAAAPQIHSGTSTAKIMWTVSFCLIPAGIWGVFLFGIDSLFIVLISIASAMLTEGIISLLLKRPTLFDGSAFLTGLLIGYNMPPTVPAFIPVLAAVFAIAVVKQAFGGLGRNWMNPALAGRAFAMFSWTEQMTTWALPRQTPLGAMLAQWGGTFNNAGQASQKAVDAISGATPLAQAMSKLDGVPVGPQAVMTQYNYLDFFLGNISGCIGEVSAFLLILGAVYLFIKKIITWEIPAAYLGSFVVLTFLFGGFAYGKGFGSGDVLFHLFTGGIILGALFMATDMVTSPLTPRGMIIYGVGCGLFTFLIRFYGGLPEGVSMAILFMNICVPLIDKFTKPVVFGAKKEEKT